MENKEGKNVINRAETFFLTQMSYNLKGLSIDKNYKYKDIENNRNVKTYRLSEPMAFITS